MFKKVLLPVDLNELETSRAALSAALEYCRSFGSDLHIMTVVPDFGMALVGSFFPDNFGEQAVEQTTGALSEFAEQANSDGVHIETHVGYGNIYEEIIEASEKRNIDLIMISASRPDLESYLLGPNAARVVRHAKCSVLVLR